MKHQDYAFSRQSRTFLCGLDQNEYSASALEWLIDTLADDGDEIIALRVLDPRSRMAEEGQESEQIYRQEARKIMDEIVEKNDEDKAISIVVELSVGKVQTTIEKMIHMYQPDSLIVGTRGRALNGISSILPGSISKWCLQNSPVPVIVVRPDRKRSKAKKKRLNDPTRKSYLEILEKSSSFDDLNKIFAQTGVSANDAAPNPKSTGHSPNVSVGSFVSTAPSLPSGLSSSTSVGDLTPESARGIGHERRRSRSPLALGETVGRSLNPAAALGRRVS